MAEERILIARSTDYTISDTKDGALFEGKIAPHNANVYTRQEAIERMAKAICKETNYQCSVCDFGDNKEKCEEWIVFQYKSQAKAALNVLLEGKKRILFKEEKK